MTDTRLTRAAISAAVEPLGWRFVSGFLQTFILVASISRATQVASRIAAACDAEADGRLRLALGARGVLASLQSPDLGWVSAREIVLAGQIHKAVAELGLVTDPRGDGRGVQVIELAIDALDASAIRPFWRAILGYADEPGSDGPTDPIVDPYGQGPAIWFQQMDVARPQRNRIHVDIGVSPDEAPARISGALDAGGTLLSDRRAPAFWVLADAEGNEACVCTWEGRDE